MPQPARLAVQQRLWPRQCLWPTCDCPPTPRVAPAALWRALAAESWWAPHPPEPQARATPQPARQGGADRRGGVCGVRGVAQRAACGSCINVTQPLGGSKQPARMPRCIPLTSAASGSAMNSRVAVHAATSHTDSTPRGRRISVTIKRASGSPEKIASSGNQTRPASRDSAKAIASKTTRTSASFFTGSPAPKRAANPAPRRRFAAAGN